MASFVDTFEEGPDTCEVDGCVLTFEAGCKYDPPKSVVLDFLEFLGEVLALADAVTFFSLDSRKFLGIMMFKI